VLRLKRLAEEPPVRYDEGPMTPADGVPLEFLGACLRAHDRVGLSFVSQATVLPAPAARGWPAV